MRKSVGLAAGKTRGADDADSATAVIGHTHLCTTVRNAKIADVSLYDKDEDLDGTNMVPFKMANKTPSRYMPTPHSSTLWLLALLKIYIPKDTQARLKAPAMLTNK